MNKVLLDFIKEGNLGFLKIGITRKNVESEIGLPNAYSINKNRVEIWKFEDLQVSFEKNRLTFIGVYFGIQKEPVLPNQLLSNINLENFSTELEPFTRFLKREKIDFIKYLPLTQNEQVCLLVKSGVHIYFLENNLHSLQFSEFTLAK